MTNPFSLGMTKATALTRTGNLTEAVALIQSLMAQKTPDAPEADDTSVIDGTFVRLDGSAPGNDPKAHPAPRAAPRAGPNPRPSLREALRTIAAGGMPASVRGKSAIAKMPDGAQFLDLTHDDGRQQRDYKLYIPANRPAHAMPLIVMLHGCTQSPDDFAAGTGMNALAEQHGLLVAYPAQPTGANANKCWNWFRPEDQRRDQGEPALIAGLTRAVALNYAVDRKRIYIAGLSAGGAAAAIMGSAYPDLFAAVGVHSGLAVGAASDIPQAFSAMRSGASGKGAVPAVPTIVFHGTADLTVHPSNGKAVVAQILRAFVGLKATERKGVSAGGRSHRTTAYTDNAGRTMCEYWEIDGAGHAWAGGHANGSFTDPTGPSSSDAMLQFFLQHRGD